MFSRANDASKVALVHLVAALLAGGYQMIDTQFITHHLARFGAIEIPRNEYRKLLEQTISEPATFVPNPGRDLIETVLSRR
jgi:leucyl/phenylalanyl-tRNA--protein transferase